jgi:hypothetical protein
VAHSRGGFSRSRSLDHCSELINVEFTSTGRVPGTERTNTVLPVISWQSRVGFEQREAATDPGPDIGSLAGNGIEAGELSVKPLAHCIDLERVAQLLAGSVQPTRLNR